MAFCCWVGVVVWCVAGLLFVWCMPKVEGSVRHAEGGGLREGGRGGATTDDEKDDDEEIEE